MLKFERIQTVGKSGLEGLRHLALALWVVSALRPWVIAADPNDLSRGMGAAAALLLLGVATTPRAAPQSAARRVIGGTLLALAPHAGGVLGLLPFQGGLTPLLLGLSAVFVCGIALARVAPPASGHPVIGGLGAAVGLLAADVWPGPELPLPLVGTAAALFLMPGAPAPAPDRPRGETLGLCAAALAGAAIWIFHRPWVAFLTPTRAAEAEWAAAVVFALAIGARMAGRVSTPLALALAAVGTTSVGWVMADLPLSLGLWGGLDRETWGQVQWARTGVALALAAPIFAPLGAAAARGGAAALLTAAAGMGAAVALLPWVPAGQLLWGLVGGTVLLAGVSARADLRRSAPALVLAGAAAVAFTLAPAWDLQLMTSAVYPQLLQREGVRRSIAEARARTPRLLAEDGRGSVAVFDGGLLPSLVVAGAPVAASLGQVQDERFLGHLATLLHPHPDRSAVLGPGLGAAIDALRLHELKPVVASPSRARWDALRELGPLNGEVATDPAIRAAIGPLRGFLRGERGLDLIVVPAAPLWTAEGWHRTTLEWARLLRRSLADGGIAATLLPLDGLHPEDLAGALAAWIGAFPATTVWLPPSGSHGLILVGHADQGQVPYLRVLAGMTLSGVRRDLAGLGYAEPAALVARLLLGPPQAAEAVAGAAPLTDARPRLDTALPAAAFRPPAPHALTLLAAHLAPLAGLVSDVEEGPTLDALTAAMERARASQAALFSLLGSLGSGSYDDAVGAVLQMGPQSDREVAVLVEPYLERARRDLSLGLLDQAQAQLGFAAVVAPRQAAPWVLMARVHVRRNQEEAAVEAYRKALEREPDNLEAQVGLADLLQAQGRITEATNLLEQARARSPSTAVLSHDLGELYRLQGDLERAESSFKQALLLDRSLAPAHAGLAQVLLQRGELGAALGAAHTAVRLEEKAIHFEILGQVLLALKDYNRARSAFVQCLLRDPDDIPCLGGMGIVYANEEQLDKARASWEKILELEPGNGPAQENLRRLKARADASEPIPMLRLDAPGEAPAPQSP